MPSKVWDEITYQFPNFNGVAVDVCFERDKYFHPILYDGSNDFSILES